MIFLTCATTWIPHSWTLFILTAANVDHHRCAPVFCCINVGSIDGVNSMIFPPPPFFPVVCVFYSLCIALWCIYVIVILCKYTGSLSNDRQDDKTEGQRSVQEEKRVGPTAAEETDSNYHSWYSNMVHVTMTMSTIKMWPFCTLYYLLYSVLVSP